MSIDSINGVGKVFFDITDIVHYASRESRVSGIQRVQIRIIGSFARMYPGDAMVVFEHPGTREIFWADAAAVFCETDFDAIGFLSRLGLISARRYPKKKLIVQRLSENAGRLQIYREQLKVYFSALFARERLIALGFSIPEAPLKGGRIKIWSIKNPGEIRNLIFLGTNWSFDGLHRLASDVKDAGGQVFQLIHDLIPLRWPDFCGGDASDVFRKFLDESINFATAYLAVSEFSANDLRAYLKDKGVERGVKALRLAHEFSGFPRESCDPSVLALNAPSPYLLFVGTLDRRKNIENLALAWEIVALKMGDSAPNIVLAGRRGWDSREFFDIVDRLMAAKGKFIFHEGPSDQELAHLYANAEALILPSYAEGWGLPVGEAAWFGTPSLISATSSLPEVCPESSVLIEGLGPEEISDAVIKFVRQGGRATFASHSAEWKLETWDDVAKRLHELLVFSS